MHRVTIALLTGGLVWVLLSPIAWAVPAPPFPIQVTNEDGSRVWARMFGDEHLSWCEDLSGYSLAYDGASGVWTYAQLGPDGRLVPTLYRAGAVDPELLGLSKHLRPSAQSRRTVRDLRDAALRSPQPLPGRVTGDFYNLVLLVRFANQTTEIQPSEYDTVFNGPSASVKAYYDEVSYGQVNLNSTIVGSIDLPYNDTYYVSNEHARAYPHRMVQHAVNTLEAQGFDFTQFDSNNDGEIDAVDVIHSGPGYEVSGDPDHIHSHYARLDWYGEDFWTNDGIHFVAYHTEPETNPQGNGPTQIGVIVHETAHFFGLPDLYDYDGDSGGIGMWGIMAAGPWAGPWGEQGTVPTHPSAWAKIQLDWITPQHIQADAFDVLLRPAENFPEVVRVDEGMPWRQYFLLENRQQIGSDTYLPGEGLLIYHVDDNQNDNDNQNHYLVDVEQADGMRELNLSHSELGDANDPWPYGSNDDFTPSSTPSTVAYGQTGSDISVVTITRQGENVLFNVDIAGSTGSYLALSPASLFFQGTVEAAFPPAQTVNTNHQGLGPISWTGSPQSGWVQVSPGSGSTPDSFQVSVSTAGLGIGTYQGSVRFTSPTATNTPINLPIVLEVQDRPPEVSIDQTAMAFSFVSGGQTPPGQVLLVTNSGGGTLNWLADRTPNWIDLSTSAGTAPSAVTVTADVAGLSSGQYSGQIRFSEGGGTEAWLDVSLVVQDPGHLRVTPDALHFTAEIGQTSPPLQEVAVDNSLIGTLAWNVSCAQSWLTCQPLSGTTPGTVQVVVDSSQLALGEHTAVVAIASDAADNSPLEVPVTLVIEPENDPPGVPTPVSPSQMSEIDDPNPELTVQNTLDPDGDVLTYDFEVYAVGSDVIYWSSSGIVEGISFTSILVEKTLDLGGSYQWRARAVDDNGAAGNWCEQQLFTVRGGSGGGCGCGAGGASPFAGLLGLAFLGMAVKRRSRLQDQ